MSANAPGSSSLRPAWYKGAGGAGGRGFQPPPTVTSERGDKGRSSSWGSQERKDSNKFSALQDEEDGPPIQGNGGKDSETPSVNSRSEAFRSSFNRSSSTGSGKPPGRSLADLAARVPEPAAPEGRRTSGGYQGRGSGAPARFTGLRPDEAAPPGSSETTYKSDSKVIRYTREKLLSMRAPPTAGEEPPESLKHMEGTVILSKTPQDPVCWDPLDAEEIWATVPPRERQLSIGAEGVPKPNPGLGRGIAPAVTEDPRARRNPLNAPISGRWKRGVALPPPEEGGRKKEKDAEDPEELWDDPVGGATGAASDFSAFGGMLPSDDGEAFDFDKMAEESRRLEAELRGTSDSVTSNDEELQHAQKIDPKRPLASTGTTIVSGSGDDVNVFEDFDAPGEGVAPEDPSIIRAGDSDPSASSRLMKMIGVNKNSAEDTSSNPWGTNEMSNKSDHSSPADPILGAIPGLSTAVSLNPWGDPIIPSSAAPQQEAGGMDLAARLQTLALEQRSKEAHIASEMEQRAQQAEMLRRRQEEEVRQHALAQRQAEERVRQQQAQAAVMQQAQNQQSQVELVLMERICSILENSWGRSDLVSILTTLHSEDSRVIPLLGNVDALRALIARSPQRVVLRRDQMAGDMAQLLLTNVQWQQQQQARAQQEELQRREQQRRLEEEAVARERSAAQHRPKAQIDADAPWFYSDPQGNVQGPFRGEEMRQWLEAGYFKGDLPISQQPSGPFFPLQALFTDLSVAFRAVETNAENDDAEAKAAAADEKRRMQQEDEERRVAGAAAMADAKKAWEAAEHERAERELKAAMKVEAMTNNSADGADEGNESSTQLKMMLGLSETTRDAPSNVEDHTSEKLKSNSTKKGGNKKSQHRAVDETAATEAPAPVATPAAAAWGGASKTKPKKTMAEIQQEEGRAAALLAMQNANNPVHRQSSSGWANVAAKGTTGWSSGTIKPSAAALASNTAAMTATGPRPAQAMGITQQPTQSGANRKVAPLTVQQRSVSSSSSTPAEEFGTSMSPALEKWCKEQMQRINGSEDLTLVAFCMTLTDANEIRQYLTTYLGGTAAVNSFATEFITKRGLGPKQQEEWETPGSTKKGRKKKAGR